MGPVDETLISWRGTFSCSWHHWEQRTSSGRSKRQLRPCLTVVAQIMLTGKKGSPFFPSPFLCHLLAEIKQCLRNVTYPSPSITEDTVERGVWSRINKQIPSTLLTFVISASVHIPSHILLKFYSNNFMHLHLLNQKILLHSSKKGETQTWV